MKYRIFIYDLWDYYVICYEIMIHMLILLNWLNYFFYNKSIIMLLRGCKINFPFKYDIYLYKAACPFVCHVFSFLAIPPVWDLIETWGFREDLPLVFPHDPRWQSVGRSAGRSVKNFSNFNFSALGLDRDLGFSRGTPSGIPPRS